MKSIKKTVVSTSEGNNAQNVLTKPERKISEKKAPNFYADDEEFDITLEDDLDLFEDLDEDEDDNF